MRDRLIYSSAVPGFGRVRVTYSRELNEYTTRLYPDPRDGILAEYFTDDRTDAIGTAQLMLAALAEQGA